MKHNNYSISDELKNLILKHMYYATGRKSSDLTFQEMTWDTVITVKATLKLLSR